MEIIYEDLHQTIIEYNPFRFRSILMGQTKTNPPSAPQQKLNELSEKEIIDNISESEWKELSNNGRDWYNENCSRLGSFETTKTILEGRVDE